MQSMPFYKNFVFYISLIALLVSFLSLGIQVLTSPYFGLSGPEIVFRCEEICTGDLTDEEQRKGRQFKVSINNNGKAPAENVVLSVYANNYRKEEDPHTKIQTAFEKADIYVHVPYSEYSIVREQFGHLQISFPLIAPNSRLLVTIKNCLPMNLGSCPEYDLSVVYKNGTGRYENPGVRPTELKP